ncbi:hypothetical protein DS2_17958 [Catenovulum agarivorans DS-2]|uniref:Uncharacterized protein n=1 Tax=Catenovulum agarivorans DS-2 TaxID=1328313 RepID=W7Q6B9_9ALTE|nr:tetratricopeptide repeat protein [Catenovulum agarivorans]EWH08309.1 hypothetical protein DS2_17958 [Catenovulum agarivorans DS-2]
MQIVFQLRKLYLFCLVITVCFSTQAQDLTSKSYQQQQSKLTEAFIQAQSISDIDQSLTLLLQQIQLAISVNDSAKIQEYLIRVRALKNKVSNTQTEFASSLALSQIYRRLELLDQSLVEAELAEVKAREMRDAQLIMQALRNKGYVYKAQKQNQDALRTFLSALRYQSNTDKMSQAGLMRNIADAYSKINELVSSARYYEKATAILTEFPDNKLLPQTLIILSKTQNKMGDYAQALININQALTIAQTYFHQEQELDALTVLSILHRKLGNYEDALKFGLQALAIYDKLNDPDGIAAAANSIGLICIHLDQYDNARSYFNQVLQLNKSEVNPKYRAAAYRELGKLIVETDPNKGLNYVKQAHAIFTELNDLKGAGTALKNLANIYIQLGEVDQAQTTFAQAIDLFTSIQDVWNQTDTQIQLASTQIKMAPNQVANSALSSLQAARKIGAKSLEFDAYNVLQDAEEALGNYRQALQYAKQKEILSQQLKTESLNKKMAEMNIVLQVEKKQHALIQAEHDKSLLTMELNNKEHQLSLLKKDKEISELTIKYQFIINLLIGACTMVILFFVGRKFLAVGKNKV